MKARFVPFDLPLGTFPFVSLGTQRMESDNTSSTPGHLEFYCRDCDAVFEAAPDGTGYEQAPCPACGEMCLTVQFEQEERRRNEAEAQFGSVLSRSLIGLLGCFFGVRSVRSARACGMEPPRASVRKAKFMTIARYETREDAEADAGVLAEHGLHAQVVGEETPGTATKSPDQLPPFELQMPEQGAFAAAQILRALDPPEGEDRAEGSSLEEDVVFPCEECGAMLQFPSDRRGKVDVCRHCGEYVDVPK